MVCLQTQIRCGQLAFSVKVQVILTNVALSAERELLVRSSVKVSFFAEVLCATTGA